MAKREQDIFWRFSQPSPQDMGEGKDPSHAPEKGHEYATISLDAIQNDIAVLQEQFDSRAVSMVDYNDRMLELVVQREDLLRRCKPSNQEIVRSLTTKYSTLDSVQEHKDFEVVETLHPLSGLSEEVKTMRKLVKETVGLRFAYHPFLHALFMSSTRVNPSYMAAQTTTYDYRYTVEQLSSLRHYWQKIDSLSDVSKNAKALAALLILASIAEDKLTKDMQGLRDGSKTILPNAEEEFWRSCLFGKPRNEGILFCRHYVNEARQKVEGLAKELYGARAQNARSLSMTRSSTLHFRAAKRISRPESLSRCSVALSMLQSSR